MAVIKNYKMTMKRFFSFLLSLQILLAMVLNVAHAGPAKLGEPLKEVYVFDDGSGAFVQTGDVTSSFSFICDMGQAIPDPDTGSNWYTNRPIDRLKLELRARAAFLRHDGSLGTMGFVVISKNGDILKTFDPVGEYANGVWSGDIFNSWSARKTDIRVCSRYSCSDGYAEFDVLDGQGLYYKFRDAEKPDYFLSNCRRIEKQNLPVYDWDFSYQREKE